MATHPNRSKKTISVKLSEEQLDWLIYASRYAEEDTHAGGDEAEKSYPGSTGMHHKLISARSELRSRQ